MLLTGRYNCPDFTKAFTSEISVLELLVIVCISLFKVTLPSSLEKIYLSLLFSTLMSK